MRPTSRTVPGTGLSLVPYLLLIAFSVVLFLFWDGPLWTAKRDASHVMRFVVSYLAVVPAAGLMLLAARRFSWSHLIAATGSAWAIKLMVTSTLYLVIARGTAHIPVAAPLPTVHRPAASYEYHAARNDFARGRVSGTVLMKGAPAAGAVVMLDNPLPGAAVADAKGPLVLRIGGERYSESVYVGQAGQEMVIENQDPTLHTLHLFDHGRAVLNVPVPAGEKPRPLAMPDAGIYEARCDNHASERATVVIVDHPYVVRADESGNFTLNDVTAGNVTLVVVHRASDAASAGLVRRVSARVENSETTTVHVDLATPEVAEERL